MMGVGTLLVVPTQPKRPTEPMLGLSFSFAMEGFLAMSES